MKKLLLISALILSSSLFIFNSANAQAPQQFNYQGVARDAGGNELVTQSIGLQLSLRSGSAVGPIVYQETQNPTTNGFGLFNIKVGNGTVVAGDMATIDWGASSYYLQVEMDATGGTSYADMGTAQLLSVPYALYAETSGNGGVPGPTGPAGADGNDGLNGTNGATGPTGPQGPAGADGADGADGTSVTIQGSVANSSALPTTGNTNGDGYLTEDDGHLWVWNGTSWTDAGVIQGPAGADGADGAIGPQGPTGANGNDGATGPTGPQGIAGTNGIDGATGPTGLQGPAGANGNDGTTGPQGPTGAQGVPGNDGADGVDGATGPTGPQGPAGADGADGTSVTIQGSVANSGALPTTGNTNGDGYLTEDDGHLWVWNGSSWIDAGLIQGPAGADGADGATGPQGPTGAVGANGNDGATGPTGPQGPTGAAGTNGATGPTGPQGIAGNDGNDGTNGVDGATGPQGPIGPAGATGLLNAGSTAGNTPYWNGTNWVVNNNNIYNNGANVGIGTDSPQEKLHVNGSARTATAFISDTDRGSSYAGFAHVNTDPTTGYALFQTSAGLTALNAEAGEKILFRIGNTEHMRVDDSGFIGIGTTSPDVELHVNGQFKLVDGTQGNGKVLTSSATGLASWQDADDGDWTISGTNLIGSGMGVDGALIVGSTSMDSIAGTDNDKRMFYNQALGTFRAGEAENSEWDVANQGVFSAAFGKNNMANGNNSFTAGLNSIASGSTSIAMGYNTEASGNSSSALGEGHTASGAGSFAAGLNNIASGSASTAMGLGVTASGQGSVALGQNSTASGEGAVALGVNITASGHYSSAFGLQSSASGYAAVARGFESHADGDYAVAIGHSNQAPTIGETTIGLYATTYTPADANSNDTWYGTDRLFTIGNGTGTASRSNAVTVLKNGNVGIGSTNPYYAKFVVNGYQTRNIVGAFLNSAGTIGSNNIDRELSAYFTHDVAAATYHAFSDARIKNIKGVSNSAADLATLASIEVTDYTMKDTISKGKQTIKKVIAQQVKEVYPQAVNDNLTDAIPNIYKLAEIENGWVNLKTDLQVGDRVKLIFSGSDQVFVVKEVTENGFKVDTDQEGKVFVYGQEVNDFHTVDYEAIAMLNVSATQELLKRIESLETEKHDLKAEVESLNDRMNRIESFIYQQVGSDD